ncbi:GIY-YIG nuclease family protein [Streptomyces gardneri]|uniref:GIY-YIG nuclease family protein n=1 Tax=Streptomyces gardneri TaxID=66892 RepID=UPI0035DCE3C2
MTDMPKAGEFVAQPAFEAPQRVAPRCTSRPPKLRGRLMSVPNPPGGMQTDSEEPSFRSAPTALYRFFDADGRLLYVGITKDLQTRFATHARTKHGSWWPLVARRTVEWFSDRPTASRAEICAIKSEDPAYNQSHTPSPHLVSETGGQHISLRDLGSFEWLTFGETARRIVKEGFSASMSRNRLMYLAENDPQWPVPRSEWRYIANAWLFPWELVAAYFREDPATPVLSWAGHLRSEQPSVVTFTSGAALLVGVGLLPRMTNEGVRVASTSSDWPFGEGRAHQYWRLGNVQAMAAEPFLEFFQHRVKKPQGQRPSGLAQVQFAEKQSFRGETLLRLVEAHFGSAQFTQADLIALGQYRAAAVARNIKALVEHDRLVVVGSRPNGGRGGRPHALYAVVPVTPVTVGGAR